MFGPFYIVQSINSGEYRVHKFDGKNYLPETTYTVRLRREKVECNCPSGTHRGYCKHLDMVKKYRTLETLGETIPMMEFEG